MSATHSRDQLHDVEVGFDDDGRVLALRDDYLVDNGAWNPIGSAVAYNTAVHLTGPYKIENFAASGRVIAQQGAQCAYRGAGRPRRPSLWSDDRPHRAHLGPGAGRGAPPQYDPGRRDAVPGRHGVPRRASPSSMTAATIPPRCKRRSTRSAGSTRFAGARPRRAGGPLFGLASGFISRAPASGRSRAPLSASTRPEKSTFPAARRRRARAWRRSFPRSRPISGKSRRTMLSCRSPIPLRSRSASARWRAAAR